MEVVQGSSEERSFGGGGIGPEVIVESDSEAWNHVAMDNFEPERAVSPDCCGERMPPEPQKTENAFCRRNIPKKRSKHERSCGHRKLFMGRKSSVGKSADLDPQASTGTQNDELQFGREDYKPSVDVAAQSNHLEVSSFLNKEFKFRVQDTFDGRKEESAPTQQGHHKDEIGNNGTILNPMIQINRLKSDVQIITAKRTATTKENVASRRVVNPGWGKNFVRLNMKVRCFCIQQLWKAKCDYEFLMLSIIYTIVVQRNGKAVSRTKCHRHSRCYSKRSKPLLSRQVGDGGEYMEGWELRSSSKCFKCGKYGHWANSCDAVDMDTAESSGYDSTFPSAPKMGSNKQINESTKEEYPLVDNSPTYCQPMHEWNNDESSVLKVLKEKFGHSSFRGNQKETIKSVLREESCLSIMPTGLGKSLCYQLSAYFIPGPIIVISPLIALMQDQCSSAPRDLNAAVLWSGQSPSEARQVLHDLKCGRVKLIFISPERMLNTHFREAIAPWLPLNLVVVDEAHCISEWGQSFRPSYYRLGKVLSDEIPCKTILALTATATVDTERCIQRVLRIAPSSTFRQDAIRQNLDISIQCTQSSTSTRNLRSEDWNHICDLFKPDGLLGTSKKVVIYCAFKRDADVLSRKLVAFGIRSRPYHSGSSDRERGLTLSSFSKGIIRVVVATTAFGMGVNIPDIDAVVHANIPRSLEEYVQQIGRAGRNGEKANCIVFLRKEDLLKLRSLCSTSVTTRQGVTDLVRKIFDSSHNSSPGRYVTVDVKGLSATTSMTGESIENILGFLEGREPRLLSFIGQMPQKVKISFYEKNPYELQEKSNLVKAILKLCPKPRQGSYSINLSDLSSVLGAPPGVVLKELSDMSRNGLMGFQVSPEKGPCIRIDSDPAGDRHDLINDILSWSRLMHRLVIERLDYCYMFLLASSNLQGCSPGNALKGLIKQYFETPATRTQTCLDKFIEDNNITVPIEIPVKRGGEDTLRAVKALVRKVSELQHTKMSAVDAAHILHGVSTDRIRKEGFEKLMGVFWGSLVQTDFADILELAEGVISAE